MQYPLIQYPVLKFKNLSPSDEFYTTVNDQYTLYVQFLEKNPASGISLSSGC